MYVCMYDLLDQADRISGNKGKLGRVPYRRILPCRAVIGFARHVNGTFGMMFGLLIDLIFHGLFSSRPKEKISTIFCTGRSLSLSRTLSFSRLYKVRFCNVPFEKQNYL